MRHIHSTKEKTERRGIVALLIFLAFTAMLLINILRLDLFAYEKYSDKAYDQITTSSKLRAERGSIYDSSMNLLATTRTTWRIFLSPKALQKLVKAGKADAPQLISAELSRILGLDPEQTLKKISNTAVLDVTLKKTANEDEYKETLGFITKEGLEDVIFTEAQSSRYYPNSTMAAHVLGFTGSDNQGLYGLEYYYNSTLSGIDGYYLYAKDAGGNAMPDSYTTVVEPIAGSSIVTTIDAFIQGALESELEAILKNHDVTNRVAGIVMDTKTGAILGMATSSPFDPNSPYTLDAISQAKLDASGYTKESEEYKKLKSELMQVMWANKAVSETYEPGSTFKIITVAAALDSGSAKMSDTFSCNGYHTVGGWRIKCHKTTGHGSGFTLDYGLQMSCNPTMMTVAERCGAEVFYSYVDKFGYFDKSGIDLPSEARTIFHELGAMGSTELATASFGQRFKVSIINHLTAIAAVANGGYLVEPYVVDRVIDSNGNILSKHGTVKRGRVISEDVAKEVSAALEAGVSGDGGAKNAYVDGYSIAAKTGTSQKFDILDANGNSYLRIGSTVAYAPYNESGIAVIIVVDEPQSSVKYGSTVAAPYVSSLLDKVLPYLEYERATEVDDIVSANYIGMNINSATADMKEAKINYSVVGSGNVVLAQVPAPGVELTPSLSTIYLYTEAAETDKSTVPLLVGLGAKEANRLILNAGLNIRINGVRDLDCEVLSVISQSLPPGAVVKRGTVIEITLLRTDFED